MVLFAPVAGSASSALIWLAASLGVLRILFGYVRPAAPRAVIATAAAFLAFFLAEALSGVVNWRGLSTFGEMSANLVLIGLLPWYLLIRQEPGELLDGLKRLAPWCAFAAFGLAAVQLLVLDFRPQGGAGNPAIFAVTVANLLAVTIAASLRPPAGMHPALAHAGMLAAAVVLILGATRSQWPALAVFPLILWFFTRDGSATGRRAFLLTAAALFVATLALGGQIRERYAIAVSEFEVARDGDMQTSIGKRLVVWRVAWEAIGERPILGHGPDSPRPLMIERSARMGDGIPVIYNHFHNFGLNEMVRAGAVGTLALLSMFAVPLVLALRAPRDATGRAGLGLLACFQANFLLAGSVGLMLDHDITDAQFMATTALGLYLVFGKRGAVARAASP